MTRAEKIACRLRWVLLVTWVLCLVFGLLWLLKVLFTDIGLGGTPSVGILGPLFGVARDPDSLVYLVPVCIYLGLFMMTQWLFLSPRTIWRIKVKPSGRPMKEAAVGAAFAITLLSVGLLYSILDLVSEHLIAHILEPEEVHAIPRYAFLSIPLVLWVLWSIIFCVYWRQSDHYTWAGRVIRGLIAGSVLEMFVAIPIYATRQDDCYCVRGSYAGLVFGATVLLWAFGPGILLLFIREKQRREKLLDSINTAETA